MRILLEPNPNEGGGQGAGAGDGGQGSSGTPGQGQQAQTPPAKAPSTSERLFGGMVAPDKGSGSQGTAGTGTPGGEGNAGAGGKTGSSAPASGVQPDAGQAAAQQSVAGAPQKYELTEEVLAKLAQNIATASRPPEQQPQMTQEEFDKMFNIYRPNEELLARVLGEDKAQAVQAVQEMLHGAARQATTIASHLVQNEVQQLRQLIAPALAIAEEKQMEAMKVEFFEQYKDLKGMEPILVLIRDQFKGQGRTFKTKEEAFKAVAEEARKQIEAIPGLKAASVASAAAGSQQQTQGQASKMPGLSGGKGQSGAGDGGAASGSSGKKSTAERIFG